MDTYKQALERLAIPIAFHTSRIAGPEEQARMHFAQAILDGSSLEMAEEKAVDIAAKVQHEMVCRSLRD